MEWGWSTFARGQGRHRLYHVVKGCKVWVGACSSGCGGGRTPLTPKSCMNLKPSNPGHLLDLNPQLSHPVGSTPATYSSSWTSTSRRRSCACVSCLMSLTWTGTEA